MNGVDYRAVLADLKTKRAQIDQAIAAIEEVAGERTYTIREAGKNAATPRKKRGGRPKKASPIADDAEPEGARGGALNDPSDDPAPFPGAVKVVRDGKAYWRKPRGAAVPDKVSALMAAHARAKARKSADADEDAAADKLCTACDTMVTKVTRCLDCGSDTCADCMTKGNKARQLCPECHGGER